VIVRLSWALALVVLGISGLAGLWPWLPLPVLLVAVAWLPGYVILGRFLRADEIGGDDAAYGALLTGPGLLAIGCAVSLAALVPVFLPFFLAEATFASAKFTYAALLVVVGCLGVAKSSSSLRFQAASARPDWVAACFAVAVLLPVVLSHAGATIDDWWDLSFIRAYVERPNLSFAEPILGTGRLHPRFAWNSWYIVQALVLDGRTDQAVAFQSGALAAFVCTMVVSAQALLARALLGRVDRLASVLAILAVPLWLYGTEALPFFTRLHQDKFVAGLVLVPVLLSVALYHLRSAGRGFAVLVGIVAVGTCATHSLVFGVGMIGVVALTLAELSSHPSKMRGVGHMAAALLPVLLYPAGQALVLRDRFASQGIALAHQDNPVVLAHLSLERLLWPDSVWYIVNPSAVFGLIAAVAVVGALLWVRRSREPDMRALVALTVLPAVLIFVPGVAAMAGVAVVPWMVYRIGWLVPVPLLLAAAIASAWRRERFPILMAGVVVVAALIAVVPIAGDRLQRNMREHPAQREGGPRGTTKALYAFLATLPRDTLIVAETGVSRLVPSMSGRSTLAMAERATLVFSPDEATAYRRLRDRASFFAQASDAQAREQVVARYGLTHAVLRRRWITEGSENRWLRGSVGAAFPMYAGGPASRTAYWDRAALLNAMPRGSRVVLESSDFFVVEFGAQVPRIESSTADTDRVWSGGFDLSPAVELSQDLDVVASAVRYPGARAELYPPPLALGATSFPVWTSGAEVWDDAPSEVRIVLTMNDSCPLQWLELIPYLPTGRREVFEISVGERVTRRLADHKRAVLLKLDGSMRKRVEVRVRSMLGVPFGIADLRLRAKREHCAASWKAFGEPEWPQARLNVASGMDLAFAYPRRAASSLVLANALAEDGRSEDALAVLRLAVGRSSGETVPWIEQGLLQDGDGGFAKALRSFNTAVALDSNSAWARGCLAWAELRRQRPWAAVWHASQAAMLDHDYADAYTILASSAKQVGLRGLARTLLQRSIEMDRYRSWGYLELARMMDEDGDRHSAISLIESYLVLAPFDTDAQSLLDYYSGSTVSD
jgi:hypothetical protein